MYALLDLETIVSNNNYHKYRGQSSFPWVSLEIIIECEVAGQKVQENKAETANLSHSG